MTLVSGAPIAIADEVVIAGGRTMRHRSLPGALCLPNGELLVAFRSGTDKFVTDDGAVVLVRSMDGGRTWSDAIPLMAEPGWDCFGGSRLVQVKDGSLLMLVGKARWIRDETPSGDTFETHSSAQPTGTMPSAGHGGETRREIHNYAVHSSDGGRTWSELGPSINLFGSWTEPYARRTIKLEDGRLMIGFHGSDQAHTASRAGVAFSEDRGRTWTDFVTVASEPGVYFHEVELLRLGTGPILAVIRTNKPAPYDSYWSVSCDDGRSWSPPRKTGFSGHCPFLFALDPQTTLCLYRDLHPARRGVSVSMTRDSGQSWRWLGQLYRAPNLDCGYPSLMRLPTGELLCVFYTSFVEGNSEIHGVFLQERAKGV